MKTRSAARHQLRHQLIKAENEATKLADLEQQKIEAEIWLRKGRVVNPELKEPPAETLLQWKLFIISAYSHPNILVHSDFQCIRDLFQFLGVYITYETSNLIVELNAEENGDIHELQPYEELLNVDISLALFGKIKNFEIIPNLNAVIVREYSIMPNLKTALSDLVEFIWTYPEALLYENYAFIYEFLLKFGVLSDVITYEIYMTQCRRAENKLPASTLLLKFGVPESIVPLKIKTEVEDPYLYFSSTSEQRDAIDVNQFSLGRRKRDSCSEDSGIESWDSFDSSAVNSDLDTSDSRATDNLVIGKKSVVKEEPTQYDDVTEDSGKPFKCTTCSKRFVSKANCNSHIRNRHPGAQLLPLRRNCSGSFPCPFCGKCFTSSQYLRNHIERLHPESSSKQGRQTRILDPSFKFLPMKKVLKTVKLEHPPKLPSVVSSRSRRSLRFQKKSDNDSFHLKLEGLLFQQPKQFTMVGIDKF